MTDSELEKLDKVLNILELISCMLISEDGFSDDELKPLLGNVDQLNTEAIKVLDTIVPRPLPPRIKKSSKDED